MRVYDWDPIRAGALWPAASTAAQTGRTRDRTRPMLQVCQKVLAKAPSTRDPTRTLASDGFNLWLEMFVFLRFLLVARAQTLMYVLAASHRWAHCALVSAPALRHNRRQALATASLHWQSSPSQARCPSGERV